MTKRPVADNLSSIPAIPIDVLRAFVAVVNARGFTRAAEQLGRTQPTISLQVKRLEELIETPLFENSTRLVLTRAGAICLDYGVRVLQQHDEMFERLAHNARGGQTIRLGLASDVAPFVMAGLGDALFAGGSGLTVDISCGLSEQLIAAYRLNQLDIALAVTMRGAASEAAAQWRMPMGWFGAPGYAGRSERALRLITTPEESLPRQLAVAALEKARRQFEIVCVSADDGVIASAVAAGAGVAVMMRASAPGGLTPLPDEAIAPVPDVVLGLYCRRESLSERGSKLVANIAELIGNMGHALVAA